MAENQSLEGLAGMDRALIVRQPWLDKILAGEKIWEMRSRPTRVRGRIGLIEQGTGLIVGECILQGVGDPIDSFEAGYGLDCHRVEDQRLLVKWRFPWILSDAKRYEAPIRYDHPQGAVTWVRLDGCDVHRSEAGDA